MPRATVLHVTTVPMSLRFLRGQAGHLRARGLEIRAVSSPGEELAEFAAGEGVETFSVPMPRQITPLQDLRSVGRLRGLIRSLRPEIVHAHTPKGGLLGMLAARLAGVPVRVYHMRGLPFVTATGFRRRLLKATERLSCRLAHRVLCVSHGLRDVALAEGLCPAEKITVLAGGSGNGVDAAGRYNPDRIEPGTRGRVRRKWNIPDVAPVVGFVGRLVRDKGVVELAEAWQVLRREFPAAHLLLIGPEEERDAVPPVTLAALRDDPRVHLVGKEYDTPPLYATMDLVVLPTYREGFPNVPLEAAAMGLPVVATRIPGCVDAVADGVTGTLVPPRDARALADAVAGYLRDPELRRRHGEAGRVRVLRGFRQEVIWEALYGEYVRLLRERGLSVPAATAAGTADAGDGAGLGRGLPPAEEQLGRGSPRHAGVGR